MADGVTTDLEAFRLEVRDWLKQNFPQSLIGRSDLAALESPVIGCRNIALNTLDAWRKADYPLTPALQEIARAAPPLEENLLYFPGNIHLTPRGHAAVARILAGFLRDRMPGAEPGP